MVSVIIPVLNREKTISRAIDSVIRQTYKDWELIIVDDGCTDNTIRIVNKYKKKYNIRVVKNKLHGVASARNTGILNSKGDYIAFLDSDDEWLECHLTESVTALQETNYKMCSSLWIENKFGKTEKIGTSGWYNDMFNEMKDSLGVDRSEKYWKFDSKLFKHILKTDFYCFHINTIVISREILTYNKLFDPDMKASEDLDFIYRLLQDNNILTINNYHFIYHYGKDNLYAFIDRNALNVDDIVNNRKKCDRICFNLKYKIILCEKLLKIISTYKSGKEKSEIKRINVNTIYTRMMTYAYLCRKKHPLHSLFYCFKAAKFFRFNNGEKNYLFDFFSSNRKNNLYID